ncbi:MAG: thioesterase family protein [Desulfobulbaceae bacterium]|jgi:fluoroacetyl-CoA thioesterase|nr:thioesterase family protein [Desulfobulbaceae bacterium]
MKETLREGLAFQFAFKVPVNKTVPHLLPESPEFQAMPRVLATGYMVGLIEWACIQAVNPHLDWPAEQTVGVGVNLSHSAATPPGLVVTIDVKIIKIEGRKLTFSVSASDGVDDISQGFHERFIILADKFNERAEKKAKAALAK